MYKTGTLAFRNSSERFGCLTSILFGNDFAKSYNVEPGQFFFKLFGTLLSVQHCRSLTVWTKGNQSELWESEHAVHIVFCVYNRLFG